ncbi:hypothetical protein TDB9533_00688 [Thalassocella blandensis]|nr:hypothetical protein TDB9533_00688 [Thalassocella blandensis]
MLTTMKKNKIIYAFILTLILPVTSHADYCPDYSSAVFAPELDYPAKKPFNNWLNNWLTALNPEFHMVHDQIVKEGETATLVGKFDYSALYHKDLEFENIHAYIFGTGMDTWEYLGNFETDRDGKIFVDVQKPEGDYLVRMVVEGDLTEATGYLTVVKPGRKTVLFDIDGTITLNDFEAVGDYLGIDYADTHAYVAETVWQYIDKGYQIVYLTGRPYWLALTTRNWFDSLGMFPWHLRTNSNAENPLSPNTEEYKTDYIQYLLQDVELDIIRAYGNASTDITAYAGAGIAPTDTYIIGKNAGNGGTNAISGDYAYHYSTVVTSTPEAGCSWR